MTTSPVSSSRPAANNSWTSFMASSAEISVSQIFILQKSLLTITIILPVHCQHVLYHWLCPATDWLCNQSHHIDCVPGVVCTAYQYFAHTVRFSPALLTRIMELCSHQQPQGGIKPLTIVKSVYSDLQTRGRVSKDAYRLYMKTLFEFNKPEKWVSKPWPVCMLKTAPVARAIEVYQTMRAQGEPPNYDIILLMIRLNEALEHRWALIWTAKYYTWSGIMI